MNRLCQYCGESIPTKSPSGTSNNNRKACYQCRPLLCFSNKPPEYRIYEEELFKKGKKQCNKCLKEQPLSEFIKSLTRKTIHKPICNTCRRLKRKMDRDNIKKKAIKYLGGKCCCCGFNQEYGLQFHHIDPTQKEFVISHMEHCWDSLKPELDKCALVCSNCHFGIHAGIKKLPATCGAESFVVDEPLMAE